MTDNEILEMAKQVAKTNGVNWPDNWTAFARLVEARTVEEIANAAEKIFGHPAGDTIRRLK